jgi:predicted ATPase
MPMWIAIGGFFEPWARWHLGSNQDTSLAEMRLGVASFREVIALWVPLVETALAEVEAEAGEIEAALGTLDRANTETHRTGQRWFEAEIHRVRGEILLMRDPANPAPAEAAFLAAIAIAQQQKARSFKLRAALGLSKLYHTANRNADAHAVLAPALEGFSPTPEFPEIEQAQVLLAILEVGRSATLPR